MKHAAIPITFCADEDKNGVIDHDELNRCFRKLGVSFTEEEIDDLFNECDINEDMRVEFDEFIVLLCLVYLLQEEPASSEVVSSAPPPKKTPL